MERSDGGSAVGGGPPRRVDRLVATALLQALHPDGSPHARALVLSRLADGRPQALDLAVKQILRREHGRPTGVTMAATDLLRLARGMTPSATEFVAVDEHVKGGGATYGSTTSPRPIPAYAVGALMHRRPASDELRLPAPAA